MVPKRRPTGGRVRFAYQTLRPGVRRVLSNAAWLFLDRLLRLGLGVVVSVWIARYLGPQNFGLLNFAIAFASLFGVIATLGLDSVVVRDIVRAPEEAAEIIGTAFILKLLSGGVTIVLAVGTIVLFPSGAHQDVLLVTAVSLGSLFVAFDAVDFWFQSQVLSKYVVYARNSAFVISAAVRIVLIKMGASVLAFAGVFSFEAFLAALGLVIAYRSQGHTLMRWSASVKRAKVLLRESWPLMFTGLAIVIYMRIDQVMLREMKGASAVGVYSAATRVSEVWYFIPIAIVSSLFPAIVRTRDFSRDLYYRRLRRLFSLMAALSIAIALPMTFLSGTVIDLTFGNEFHAAGSVLAVHIWAALFVFWGVAQQPWYLVEGLVRLNLSRTAAGAVANVLLNLVLIPRYGSLGAAISTVAAYALAAVLANAFSSKTRLIFKLQMQSIMFPRYLFTRS